jgi:hypothetical protein
MHHEVHVRIKAGLHSVGVDFLRESAKPEMAAPPNRAENRP